MLLSRGSRVLQRQLRISSQSIPGLVRAQQDAQSRRSTRWFSGTQRLQVVKPVLLADIGEGIVECEVIQWFVEPGAQVQEFSPLCEVQSDKASVEITSRFAGTVKKLHYEAGEMARVGKAFVDIDIEGEVETDTENKQQTPSSSGSGQNTEQQSTAASSSSTPSDNNGSANTLATSQGVNLSSIPEKIKGKCAALATPAVRHLSKELNLDINDIDGTGKDGRVLKEDIHRYVKQRDSLASTPIAGAPASGTQVETRVQLTPVQRGMFKSMTRSLTIPHFLYTDEADFAQLVELRARLNKVLAKSGSTLAAPGAGQVDKLSYLPFIVKAVSLMLYQYPILNARVDTEGGNGGDATDKRPSLVMRSQHNIGIAMDTPQGLVVPVIRDVGSRNILSIAGELQRLQKLGSQGKLTAADLGGGTITVSNIGNIGGTYLSPVITEREVAILGIGRIRTVPAFDDQDRVVKRQVSNFSWSADHRVVDGATMARAAELMRQIVEEPDVMVMHLR